ncbi:DUF1622 domain-containing protein [Deinococcus lacus]|uniref:DUF1622 domain-containing protein n=1 Tax=Deinococcus lacus TaxID=392561 RepID=A0ABW1YB59_9DEIO
MTPDGFSALLAAWMHPKAWALPIEILGSLYLAWSAARAALHLLTGPALGRQEVARLLLADGVVTSLSFKAAASLLKILEVQTWSQIGMFAAVLALRTAFKRFFGWEAEQVRRSLAQAQAEAARQLQ